MIDNDSVEKVCAEVSAYSDEQIATEFDRFFKTQPAICDFIVDLTSESTPAIQELALFLSYMIFRTIESARPNSMTKVEPGEIEAAFRESESWVEAIEGTEADKLEAHLVSTVASEGEPFLVQYILSEISQPMEDGDELSDEDKGEVFFLLKTVMTSLVKSSGPRIIAP